MTILNRRTFEIKPGKLDEAVAVLQKAHAATAAPGYAQARRERVISSLFGEANLLQGEYEYETLAEYESMWAAWVQTPVAAEFAAGMGPWRYGLTTMISCR